MLKRKCLLVLALMCIAVLSTSCSSQKSADIATDTPLPLVTGAPGFEPATSPSAVEPIAPEPSPDYSAAVQASPEPAVTQIQGAPQTPQAETYEPHAITSLRASTPERFTYAGRAGTGEARVDAPINLPNVSVLPIRTLRKKPFSSADLQSIGALLAANQENRGLAALTDKYETMLTLHSAAAMQAVQSPKSGYSIIFPEIRESQPQNNPIAPDVPFARVSALLESLFPDARFYLASQTATGGGHLVKNNAAGLTDEQMVVQAPYRGYEMGHYTLIIGQALGGAPIFTENYFALGSASEPMDATVGFRASPFFDTARFEVNGSVAMPVATLAQDAALAPFAQIEKVIQARIRSGHIRSIDGITLGYMLYYAQPTTILQAAQGADMVAIPTWEVTGGMVYDPSEQGAPVMEKGLFRIDALTGKPLDVYASPAPRVYLLSELLP